MNPAGNSWHGARPYTIRVNLEGGELEAARDSKTRADTGVAAITIVINWTDLKVKYSP